MVKIREDQSGFFLPELSEVSVQGLPEIQRLLLHAQRRRSVHSTAFNEQSSRSHTLLRVTVSSDIDDGSLCVKKTSILV